MNKKVSYGLPQAVFKICFSPNSSSAKADRPKSVILTTSFLSKSKFSGV
jgi:hypothetical protein